MSLETRKEHDLFVIGREWRVALPDDEAGDRRQGVIELSIEGDEKNGFYLLMEVENCCSYDRWYKTVDEAIAYAQKVYSVQAGDWASAG